MRLLFAVVFCAAAAAVCGAQARAWNTGVLSIHNGRGQPVSLAAPGRGDLTFTIAPVTDYGVDNLVLPVCRDRKDMDRRAVRLSAGGKYLAALCQGQADSVVYLVNRRESWRGREACAPRAFAYVTVEFYEDRIRCTGYDEKPQWMSSTTPPGPNALPRATPPTVPSGISDNLP
ncbi:MAG TPA: hypothetical protein VF559_02925 [Caulobacteraceae bacterium]|jgi:hypothetical protein